MAYRLPWSRLPSMSARSGRQPVQRLLHGQHPGVENVHLVDLRRLHPGHAVGDSLGGDDLIKGLPLLFRQLFGVVQAGDVQFPWQDDGSGVHRPHQGARPGLVHAADGLRAIVPLFPLVCPKVHLSYLKFRSQSRRRMLYMLTARYDDPIPSRLQRRGIIL